MEKKEYAGFAPRLGATLIDWLLLTLITVPVMFLIYTPEELILSEDMIAGPGDFIISYVFPIVATILFWRYKCATPGKMWLKMKVVDEVTGEPMSYLQSTIRYFAYIISIIPLGLGFLWIIWDSKKQSWHDKIARTVVVRDVISIKKVEFKE